MAAPRSALDDHARERMQEARDVIESLVAEGAVVYGVTTGFGDLASTFIEPAQAGQLQENLLMSHAAGVGAPFPREIVRAMLAPARQHARAGPQRLPTADRGPAARLPRRWASTRSCPSRAVSAPRATWRRSPTWRCR